MLAWLLATAAFAGDEGLLKVLVMPLTPNDPYRPEFHALIPESDAGGKDWASDTPGFECNGNGDYVEVWVRAESWPSRVPKKVYCATLERTVKVKVILFDQVLKSMYLPNGALILPRQKGNSVIFKGPAPRGNFGVQQGRTGSLGILCEIVPGGTIEVTAYPAMEDGEGRCTLQTTLGDKVQFPVVIRSLKKSR